jgi:hypothetical protein
VIAASALAVTASAVSAIQACHSPPEGGSNTCLTLEPLGNGVCSVLVGIDVDMSQQYAQAIIDHYQVNGGVHWAFGPVLMAHDHDNPQDDTSGLAEVFLTAGWPVAWESGLSAEFSTVVGSHVLNEDTDGRDEVYARVELHDPFSGISRRFRSGIITGDNYWDCFSVVAVPEPQPDPEPDPQPDPFPEPICGPNPC